MEWLPGTTDVMPVRYRMTATHSEHSVFQHWFKQRCRMLPWTDSMLLCVHDQGSSNASSAWSIEHHFAKLFVREVCRAFEWMVVVRNSLGLVETGFNALLNLKFSCALVTADYDATVNSPWDIQGLRYVRSKTYNFSATEVCVWGSTSVFKNKQNSFWILWSRNDFIR